MLNFIFGLIRAIACIMWIAVMVFLFVTGVAFKIVFGILFGGLIVILIYKMMIALIADICGEKDSTKN